MIQENDDDDNVPYVNVEDEIKVTGRTTKKK